MKKGLLGFQPLSFDFISKFIGSLAVISFLTNCQNFPLSDGLFLEQNAILEQLEVHTPPQRKSFFHC